MAQNTESITGLVRRVSPNHLLSTHFYSPTGWLIGKASGRTLNRHRNRARRCACYQILRGQAVIFPRIQMRPTRQLHDCYLFTYSTCLPYFKPAHCG
jgi:hypothetical protein